MYKLNLAINIFVFSVYPKPVSLLGRDHGPLDPVEDLLVLCELILFLGGEEIDIHDLADVDRVGEDRRQRQMCIRDSHILRSQVFLRRNWFHEQF